MPEFLNLKFANSHKIAWKFAQITDQVFLDEKT